MQRKIKNTNQYATLIRKHDAMKKFYFEEAFRFEKGSKEYKKAMRNCDYHIQKQAEYQLKVKAMHISFDETGWLNE